MKKIMLKILIITILVIIFCITLFSVCQKDVVAIIGAMDCEIEELNKNTSHNQIKNYKNFNISTGRIGKCNVIISKSGVGKVNSGITTQYIIDKYKPKYIINIGVVGSLDNTIKLGNIVIASDTVQHDFDTSVFGYAKGYMSAGADKNKPTRFYSDKHLIDIYKNKLEENPEIKKIYIGTIATGDCFVADKNKKQYIKEYFNAIAVDMESGAIAQTAQKNNIPFIIIRNISDTNDDNLKNYEQNEEYYAKELAKTIVSTLKQ